jgi:hypothetical protein
MIQAGGFRMSVLMIICRRSRLGEDRNQLSVTHIAHSAFLNVRARNGVIHSDYPAKFTRQRQFAL